MNYYTGVYFIVQMALYWTQPVVHVPLCGTNIELAMHGDTTSSILMYNMHDNENTSAMAGWLMASRYDGQYFELIHSGDRLIGLENSEDSIFIDPNRIYTDAGIWQQLAKNNCTDTVNFEYIAEWRDSLLSLLRIRERSLVIALHNNTNQNYSLASYTAGGEYEMEADTTFQGRIRDLDDFYFVTDPNIFSLLSGGKYHIILQANETMTDDGSLSVYCGQLGIPYINIEAQHKHLIRQIRMLINAFDRLENRYH